MSTTISSSYKHFDTSLQLRGNLHTHTTRSDGQVSPQEMINAYAEMGYDFLALSDHNTVSDFSQLDDRGLLLVPANEITTTDGHLLCLGTTASIPCEKSTQETIDSVLLAGGIPFLCHPSWNKTFNHYSYEFLSSLTGYAGIEIFNGSIIEDPGSPLALDKWDRLLAAGHNLWGLATDDAHYPFQRGRGCCIALTRDRSLEALLTALRCGGFYASTGPSIQSITIEGSSVRLTAPEAEVIRVIGESGRVLSSVPGTEITFEATDCRWPYFRIEILAAGGGQAWTQTFGIQSPETSRRRELIANKPVLKALRVHTASDLSGDLPAELWEKTRKFDDFLVAEVADKPQAATEICCLLSDTSLFFDIKCTEPFIEKLSAGKTQENKARLFTDDSVELFIDVGCTSTSYLHVVANAQGISYAKALGPKRTRFNTENSEIPTKVSKSTDAWRLQIEIPLITLGCSEAPSRGQIWGFNATRNRTPVSELSQFSFTGEDNHSPQRFGHLTF
jgi:Carbohydrate family 9 binding domain-like